MNEKVKKYKKYQKLTISMAALAIIAFFLPLSSGVDTKSFDYGHSFNFVDVIRLLFQPGLLSEGVEKAFYLPFIISCILIVISFLIIVAIFILAIRKNTVHIRRVLAAIFFLVIIISGVTYNGTVTEVAKTGNNIYNVYPEFKLVIKTRTGSVNNWCNKIDKLVENADEVFAEYENKEEIVVTLQALSAEANTIDYTASDSTKKKYNDKIFTVLKDNIKIEDQEEVFVGYFKNLTKSVSNIKNTFGIGFIALFFLGVILLFSNYSEVNKNGYRNIGIAVRHMYIGITSVVLFGVLLTPIFTVDGAAQNATGFKSFMYISALSSLGKINDFPSILQKYGLDTTILVNSKLVIAGIMLFLIAIVGMVIYILQCLKQKNFKRRRFIALFNFLFFLGGALLLQVGLNKCGISFNNNFYTFIGFVIASAILPWTAQIENERYKAFSVINTILFLVICAFILVPLWKVIVDSLDATAGYGMKLWPAEFNLQGYITVLTYPTIVKPFINSVITTTAGTALGLFLATLGAYVLVQFEMPGRNAFANILLFTLIFQGGMIPSYLNLQNLHLLNTLWAVILPLSINVYYLVLMRNFFEGIPKSLIESAEIDGCSPIAIFLKIVLPLSKAALASIGLMFGVGFWNNYTDFKLYIVNSDLYNFQMKLRAMIFSSDLPNNTSISENTLQNAAIMVAIIPFMIIYPFCQQYFVKGVNIGAVKE